MARQPSNYLFMKLSRLVWVICWLNGSVAFIVTNQIIPYGREVDRPTTIRISECSFRYCAPTGCIRRTLHPGTPLFLAAGVKDLQSLASPYPTARGTTVDARQIVAAGRPHIQAILVSHVLLATEALATESLTKLRSAEMEFGALARSISACVETRNHDGLVGWINVPTDRPDDNAHTVDNRNLVTTSLAREDINGHLDGIFPREARNTLLHLATKPGDVVMIQSDLGFHLVQIGDVMADVRKLAVQKRRKQWERNFDINFEELTYKMETMGCQMNTADSERIEGQLLALGIRPHDQATATKEPDLLILNTCSIRDHAEQKLYSYLGPSRKRKREGDTRHVIVVAGCVAQQEGQALFRHAPEVDLVMGPQYANRLGDLLEDVMMNGNQVVATAATHIMEDLTKPRRGSKVAAWVNVIYGCNERCTFCIVPTTRGVEQSRPVESILKEVKELVQNQGYKEITLLGQNIDAYGRDMMPKRRFSDLIRAVGSIEGLERLRFVTSHPKYMSMGVVDAVAETDAACESFHIPFQSGSNKILSAMGRGHTREKYLRIVDRIRMRLPDASLSADVIVGFPGETEEDFQDTLDLMSEVVFDNVHTAAFSPRPGTPAATMADQVPDQVKQERLQRINALNLQHAAERRARMLGRTVSVLIEERNVKIPTRVMGRTRHNYIVYCEGDIDKLQGTTVQVKVEETETYHLVGTIVDID